MISHIKSFVSWLYYQCVCVSVSSFDVTCHWFYIHFHTLHHFFYFYFSSSNTQLIYHSKALWHIFHVSCEILMKICHYLLLCVCVYVYVSMCMCTDVLCTYNMCFDLTRKPYIRTFSSWLVLIFGWKCKDGTKIKQKFLCGLNINSFMMENLRESCIIESFWFYFYFDIDLLEINIK